MPIKSEGLRLGRLHRTYNPRVPHMSALLAGQTLPPPPPQIDYTTGMPGELGVMRNDVLGDCTCAAYYHALQVWSFNTDGSKMVTEPDSDVVKLYTLACGYNPRVPGEGPGGNEQSVLTYLLQHGAPMGSAGSPRHKITAFVEVDSRNIDDVKRTIVDCGAAYIGFNVPANLMPPNAPPPQQWTVVPNSKIIGGHAVVLAGYDANGARVISWGQFYTMTWQFFSTYVDEVYAIADSTWFTKKKMTPGGLTLEELEAQMKALQETS